MKNSEIIESSLAPVVDKIGAFLILAIFAILALVIAMIVIKLMPGINFMTAVLLPLSGAIVYYFLLLPFKKVIREHTILLFKKS